MLIHGLEDLSYLIYISFSDHPIDNNLINDVI